MIAAMMERIAGALRRPPPKPSKVREQTTAEFYAWLNEPEDAPENVRWAVGKEVWEMAGVVDHLPKQYRAALDAALATVREMVAVEGPGGWLHPDSLRDAATRQGIVGAEQQDHLVRLMFAEGHLWPVGGRLVGMHCGGNAGPSSFAWRVRSIERRPFDPGAPYPLPWAGAVTRERDGEEVEVIRCFRKGKRALRSNKQRAST